MRATRPSAQAGTRQKARIEAAAAYYKKAPDYMRQGRGDTATHKLFVERCYDLLERSGRLALVIPSGIYLAVFNSHVLDYVIRQKISATLNFFYVYQLPVPRKLSGNPLFDAIIPRAARLTCTRPDFADLWQAVMGEAWTPTSGATDAVERQQLRDELDALVAHLYGLSRDEFAHILATFPLVFPDDKAGRAKREALLAVYDGDGVGTTDCLIVGSRGPIVTKKVDSWQAVTGEAWTPTSGATDAVERQQLRDELDALAADLYGLSRKSSPISSRPSRWSSPTTRRAEPSEALLAVYDAMG